MTTTSTMDRTRWSSMSVPAPDATPPAITLNSDGKTGKTESKSATKNKMSRNHGFWESSVRSSSTVSKMLTKNSITTERYKN